MVAQATQGYVAKLAIDQSSISSSSTVFEFVSETMGKTGNILDTSGLKGTRSHASERTREGPYSVGGQIVMYPSGVELTTLLPLILGTAPSGTTYALAETLPTFNVQILKTGTTTKVFTYAGCKVQGAQFESSAGSPMKLTLDIVGQTETVSTSFTSTATHDLKSAWMHHDLVLTLAAVAREVRSISINISNALDVQFNNSVSASTIIAADRSIGVSCEVPYTSNEFALYDQALAGAAATAVFTNGVYILTFTFATLQVPAETPKVNGRADVPLMLNMVARTLSTTKELVCTLAVS